jgi:hypothetical protein
MPRNEELMIRLFQLPLFVVAVVCALQNMGAAEELVVDGQWPTCGKVCKLVCDTKKLTATCYGCECKDICLPGPSRPGCKHCAVCYGKGADDPRAECENHPPKCQFCWRDWFACGCAQPRTVRVLTKYQAEKEICWYHWEVVDSSCCDCVSKNDPVGAGVKGVAKQARRTIYKSAPEKAELGDVLAVTEEEWVKLAAVLAPDPTEVAHGAVAEASPRAGGDPNEVVRHDAGEYKPPALSGRIQKLWKK